jgi:hypothetical protein
MRGHLLRGFKKSLTVAGARLSPRSLHRIQLVVSYMRLGRWMREHGFVVDRRVPDRGAVFDTVAARVRDKRVLYLEFGVWQGNSMRYWSGALRHPQAVLHGFDSFEGLPEHFDGHGGHYRKGSLDVGGAIPRIDDPRVRFFKGWFDDVLPDYTPPEHDVMVITLDADLYSSTACALRKLRPWFRPGTLVYFDDMSRLDHEPRAFEEFMEETGLQFRLVVADESLNTAFFECVGKARGAEPVYAGALVGDPRKARTDEPPA